MCFSAKASFAAAATLSVIGVLSIKKAQKKNQPELIPFASTPLLFALQQTCEGIVWLSFMSNTTNSFYTTATYSFIFFAGAWWPTWIPVVLYQLEKNNPRKKLLLITIIIGAITSIIYLIGLITQPLQALIINHHIYYPTLSYPLGSTNTITQYIESTIPELYLTATVLPFFFSSARYMWALGLTMGAACITSQIFYPLTVASIWCFFAALASITIYSIIK